MFHHTNCHPLQTPLHTHLPSLPLHNRVARHRPIFPKHNSDPEYKNPSELQTSARPSPTSASMLHDPGHELAALDDRAEHLRHRALHEHALLVRALVRQADVDRAALGAEDLDRLRALRRRASASV
jgi:hypothetical protein